jgi:dTDP-4-dehydrorhamnose 3,5-epimerase
LNPGRASIIKAPMPFVVRKIDINGLMVIEPRVFGDERGFFMETYRRKEFAALGLTAEFVQDNHSRSAKGVLRGLHFQRRRPQAKLVRVVRGAVFDVVVDLRRSSPTFGRWYGIELSEENRLQFYIAAGFAHGFLALSEGAEVCYKCTDYYDPQDEGGLRFDDPQLAIAWPVEKVNNIIVSDKDRRWPLFRELDFLFD